MIQVQKNKLYLNTNDKFIIDKLSYHSARLYNSCLYNIKNYFEDNNSYITSNSRVFFFSCLYDSLNFLD